tara:strand:+ start:236 stop:607 length:372 start_codon:yes stop_codon:yes gene_type:complete
MIMIERYQPMQPVETDSSGTLRFRQNKIVTYLLDNGGLDLNQLARIEFPKEDRDQFTQLIGYSVSAAPISSDLLNAADTVTDEGTDTDRARVVFLEAKLKSIRQSLKNPVADLFNIHPDDLVS